ncbi:hypothetical protein ACWDUN_24030 [Mycobacterium sp. NPDC003323]
MLIIALVLALVGLAALVAAVVTSNELIAWVCIGASVIGVLLLIGDALRSRRSGVDQDAEPDDENDADGAGNREELESVQDYPEDEATVTQPESENENDTDNEADTEIAGVTDADDKGEAGGAVEISPDPEGPAKS